MPDPKPGVWPRPTLMTSTEEGTAEEVIGQYDLTERQKRSVRLELSRYPRFFPYWAYHMAHYFCVQILNDS